MVTLSDNVVAAAYARNTCAKMFGGEPRDWVRVAIESAADLSGIPHLQVSHEMIDVTIRESRAAERGESMLGSTRSAVEAALDLVPVEARPTPDKTSMWLVVHWPQVGDEVAESVWTREGDAKAEAKRLNDELGPGYVHYGYRPVALNRPRDPALERGWG